RCYMANSRRESDKCPALGSILCRQGIVVFGYLLSGNCLVGQQTSTPSVIREDSPASPKSAVIAEKLVAIREKKAGADLYGDSLPTQALARMGTVRLRDHHPIEVAAVAFSPQGNMLATGSAGGGIRFWDLATGKELRQIHGKDKG